ncbi:MAG: MgtC/SapB family protein [Phycisphaerae bacterium]
MLLALEYMPGGIETMHWQSECVLRLVIAAVLGALIGAEREHHGRSAGFRTQLLVALGSALAMLVSLNFARVFGNGNAGEAIQLDPARLAYGVMAGIGFLGAGAIIRYGAGVRGLTTAASLWCTAAVGLACGFGMYFVATIATALVIFALLFLSKLDRYIPSRWTKTLRVSLPLSQQDNIERVRKVLTRRGARIANMDYSRNIEQQIETLTFYISVSHKMSISDLMEIAQDVPEATELVVQ